MYGADTDGDPFAIAPYKYSPPTRVVVRGVTTDPRVQGNNRTHHLTFDAEELGVLNPCETYYALANNTGADDVSGKGRSLWALTSGTWNGPCREDGMAPKTLVPQWYETSGIIMEVLRWIAGVCAAVDC